MMSSFTSSAFANRRRPAKTDKVGFLNLPDEVRKKIYDLAIFDHDRGLVLLPRALPRKPVQWVDEDLEVEVWPEERPINRDELFTVGEDDTAAVGIWTDGEALWENLSTNGSDATSCASGGVISEDQDDDENGRKDDLESKFELLPDQEPCEGCYEEWKLKSDYAVCPSECECDCHPFNVEEASESEPDPYQAPPYQCVLSLCDNDHCEFCAGRGLGLDQYESAYGEKPEDIEREAEWERQDVEDEEGGEHIDVYEQTGMLYQPVEPPILLVSTEIRAQCLPVYYANNAFSWRMFWLSYERSLERFHGWTMYTVRGSAKHIMRLSFEGRHLVEEAVEFAVDIDLLPSHPYYVVETDINQQINRYDVAIAESMGLHYGTSLELLTAQRTKSIAVRPAVLYEMATIFVRAMHDYSENVGSFTNGHNSGYGDPLGPWNIRPLVAHLQDGDDFAY